MEIRKPVIGIAANLLIMDQGPFPGLERTYVNNDYVEAIELAGGIPLLLPVIADEEAIREQVARVDGVLLSGGYDVDPLRFGEEPLPQLGFVFGEVDDHQLQLAKVARQLGKPLLGICRGLQVLNIAFGGTVYQDLGVQFPGALQHNQKAKRYMPSHTVDVVAGSRLAAALGQTEVAANSFHHQAIKDIASGFRVNARAKDGVIEGMEAEDGAFTVAVQWHPEMMAARYPVMLALFTAFMAAAQETGGGK